MQMLCIKKFPYDVSRKFLVNSHTVHGIFFNSNLQTFLVFMKYDRNFEKVLVFWLSNRIHSISL